jgi:ribosome-binding factor A
MSERYDRIAEEIKHKAAEFINIEAGKSSLITVTGIDLSKNFANAIILVSVFPEDKERAALNFLSRHAKEFRSYIKSHAKLKRLPRFEFAIDKGEKNRQRLDGLINS